MEIIIILLIIISILSVGAQVTFIVIGIILFFTIAFIFIGNGMEERKRKEEERKEFKKKYDIQRRAYLNGEISEDEFEFFPKSEIGIEKLKKTKEKLDWANGRKKHPCKKHPCE